MRVTASVGMLTIGPHEWDGLTEIEVVVGAVHRFCGMPGGQGNCVFSPSELAAEGQLDRLGAAIVSPTMCANPSGDRDLALAQQQPWTLYLVPIAAAV
jgi:hypothetical protein